MNAHTHPLDRFDPEMRLLAKSLYEAFYTSAGGSFYGVPMLEWGGMGSIAQERWIHVAYRAADLLVARVPATSEPVLSPRGYLEAQGEIIR